MSEPQGRRLLLVHAHPDDEAIGTGATMARYSAEGAQVDLVTCTRGELGEVIPPELAHLEGDGERLGEHRMKELSVACAALGVRRHWYLGGPGRWRDSGMMGLPDNDEPGSFWQADLEQAAGELVRIIREARPHVIVTYDANGFYGHPDHIQAHRVAWRAFELSADPGAGEGTPWRVAKFYATAVPKSVLSQAIKLARSGDFRGPAGFAEAESVDDLPFGTPDELVTTEIDATGFLDAKLAAMRAHASQIAVDGPFFALADNVGQRAFGREFYTLLAGERGPGTGPHGREEDLFAGIA